MWYPILLITITDGFWSVWVTLGGREEVTHKVYHEILFTWQDNDNEPGNLLRNLNSIRSRISWRPTHRIRFESRISFSLGVYWCICLQKKCVVFHACGNILDKKNINTEPNDGRLLRPSKEYIWPFLSVLEEGERYCISFLLSPHKICTKFFVKTVEIKATKFEQFQYMFCRPFFSFSFFYYISV